MSGEKIRITHVGWDPETGIGIRNWSDAAAIMPDRSQRPIPLLSGRCGILEPHTVTAGQRPTHDFWHSTGLPSPAESRPHRCSDRHRPLPRAPRPIDNSGVITVRHNSRLHHIGLGRRHAGTRVLVLVRDLHVRVITDTGELLLRELTLDPTRDYQLHARP